jgi:transposase
MKKHDPPPSVSTAQVHDLIARVKLSNLADDDKLLISNLLDLLLSLSYQAQLDKTTISHLRTLLFGSSSERRSSKKFSQPSDNSSSSDSSSSSSEVDASTFSDTSFSISSSSQKQKAPGHGRTPVSAFTGAKVMDCKHATLSAGDRCPDCAGSIYDTRRPSVSLQYVGQPVIGANVYNLQVLRCSSCQGRFTASFPEGVSPQKYTPSADVTMVLSRYGMGTPFYRLAAMQASCGIPLPSSVQFERCESVADALLPIYLQMYRDAAQAELFYGDDTNIKILDLIKENKTKQEEKKRKAIYTTAIVAEAETHEIVLYFSGRDHCGENLEKLLKQRGEGLGKPKQMGDALGLNWRGDTSARICTKCWVHARRQFTKIESSYPVECTKVIEWIGQLYKHDRETKGMDKKARLEYHQLKSIPVLEKLKAYIDEEIQEKRVEPNSKSVHKRMVHSCCL